jgi:hypothetical protein
VLSNLCGDYEFSIINIALHALNTIWLEQTQTEPAEAGSQTDRDLKATRAQTNMLLLIILTSMYKNNYSTLMKFI